MGQTSVSWNVHVKWGPLDQTKRHRDSQPGAASENDGINAARQKYILGPTNEGHLLYARSGYNYTSIRKVISSPLRGPQVSRGSRSKARMRRGWTIAGAWFSSRLGNVASDDLAFVRATQEINAISLYQLLFKDSSGKTALKAVRLSLLVFPRPRPPAPRSSSPLTSFPFNLPPYHPFISLAAPIALITLSCPLQLVRLLPTPFFHRPLFPVFYRLITERPSLERASK